MENTCFQNLDKQFEDWNKLYNEGFVKTQNILGFVTLYQKLCELTPEEISKLIEKFKELKGLLK